MVSNTSNKIQIQIGNKIAVINDTKNSDHIVSALNHLLEETCSFMDNSGIEL